MMDIYDMDILQKRDKFKYNISSGPQITRRRLALFNRKDT